MSETKEDAYTGIDPAPEVKVAAPKSFAYRETQVMTWIVCLSTGVGVAALVKDLPIFLVIKMMVASKLSMLPTFWANTLTMSCVALLSAVGLNVLGSLSEKASDIGACVVGGLWHTGASILSGIGVVIKNIVPIAKTCVQIPLGLVCPAYAAHLTSKEHCVSFEKSVRWDLDGHNPPIVAVSSIVNGAVLIISAVPGIGSFFDPNIATFRPFFFGYLGWLALNALYIVGRISKEKREAAQKVS